MQFEIVVYRFVKKIQSQLKVKALIDFKGQTPQWEDVQKYVNENFKGWELKEFRAVKMIG